MVTLLTISILLVALYVGAAIWKRKSLPESISAMVYELPQGRWRWLWSVWLALVTLLLAPSLTSALSASWWAMLLADATIVCLTMTAATPLVAGRRNTAHNLLGILSGILSQLCVAVVCPWWLLVWVLIIAVGIDAWFTNTDHRWYDGTGVFLAEAICGINIYGALLTVI